jgi:hypothetical protein
MTFNDEQCYANCLLKGEQVVVCSSRHKKSHQTKQKEVNPAYALMDITQVSGRAAAALASRPDHEVVWLYPHHFEEMEKEKERAKERTASGKDPDDDEDDPEQVRRLFASLFSVDMCAITDDDIAKFHEKLQSPAKTRKEVLEQLPTWLHDLAQHFNPDPSTSPLPPLRPGQDHSIDLIPGSPQPAARMYGLNRDEGLAVKAYVEDAKLRGEIRESKSEYASPVLVVKKPGGGLRVCVDYRTLNAVTRKNRNAPPMIKETLARLSKVGFYSIVDVIAAFNRLRMKEGDEHKTAFLTRYGLFEYLVMPFGLCNAPGTFQAYINEVLRDYLDEFCSAYLDDVLIYSETLEEHQEHVRKVITKLGDAGLFMDIDKCHFAVKKVKYLGLILTTEGIEMDRSKVQTILDWQLPTTLKELQAFLGFANFYRRFIVAYSFIARPLTDLTRGTDVKKNFPIEPGSPAHVAFEKLKKAFTIAPVLAHFDPELETWVETDSSDTVTAAVLSQIQPDGVLKPVAFISQKMTPAECNYAIYDKELMAIVKAFEEWRPELAGTADPIKVISDHVTLQTFMTNKTLNRRQARWAEFLSEFNFKITYRPGRLGSKPDALTRRPGDVPKGDDARILHQVQTILGPDRLDDDVQRVLKAHHNEGAQHAAYLASMLFSVDVDVPTLASMVYLMSEEFSEAGEPDDEGSLSAGDEGESMVIPRSGGSAASARLPEQNASMGLLQVIRKAYSTDSVVQDIIRAKQQQARRLPHDLIVKHHLKMEMKDIEIRDGLAYFRNRLIVPSNDEVRDEIVRLYHDTPTAGHSGRRGTYYLVSQDYYWPLMTDTIAKYTRECKVCRRAKPFRDKKQGLLHPLPIPERFWTDVSVDFITPLPKCVRNGQAYEHCMVTVERLSKKQKFIPLASLEPADIARAFIEYVWREEGFPVNVVSDRGS